MFGGWGVGEHIPWNTCGSQRTAFGSSFSPSIVWVSGIQVRLSALAVRTLTLSPQSLFSTLFIFVKYTWHETSIGENHACLSLAYFACCNSPAPPSFLPMTPFYSSLRVEESSSVVHFYIFFIHSFADWLISDCGITADSSFLGAFEVISLLPLGSRFS